MRNKTLSTRNMYIRAYLNLLSFYRKYATIAFKRWLKWYLRECRDRTPQVVEKAENIRVVGYRYETHDELKLHALVKDPDGNRYEVRINYSPGFQTMSSSCTCGAEGPGTPCEHLVVVAQEFIRTGKPPEPELP